MHKHKLFVQSLTKGFVRLGHSRTFRSAIAMSALPPKSGHVRCNSACPLSANSGHSLSLELNQ